MNLSRQRPAYHRARPKESLVLLLAILERYRLDNALTPEVLDPLTWEIMDELLTVLGREERVAGLLPDELLAALSPEMRAALAQRLKENGSPANPEKKEPGHGDPKP